MDIVSLSIIKAFSLNDNDMTIQETKFNNMERPAFMVTYQVQYPPTDFSSFI